MACSICGETRDLSYTCNYCEKEFCSDHRLPENHNCVGLRSSTTLGPDFREHSKFDTAKRIIFGETEKEAVEKSEGRISGSDVRETGSQDERKPDQISSKNQQSSLCEGCGDPVPAAVDYCLSCRHKGTPIKPKSGDNSPSVKLKKDYYSRSDSAFGTASRINLRGAILFLLLVIVVSLALFQLPNDEIQSKVDSVVSGGATFLASNQTETPTESPDPIKSPNPSVKAAQPRTASPTATSTPKVPFEKRVEQHIHREINAVRDERDLDNLSYDSGLAEIAEYHSQDMVDKGYFSHTSPSGETMEDRYDKFGYSCRVSVSSSMYINGGENIAQSYFNERVNTGSGTERYTTAKELAKGIVNQWMHSTEHRQNLLKSYWENEGIGVVTTNEEGKKAVYVTQNFC